MNRPTKSQREKQNSLPEDINKSEYKPLRASSFRSDRDYAMKMISDGFLFRSEVGRRLSLQHAVRNFKSKLGSPRSSAAHRSDQQADLMGQINVEEIFQNF